MASIAAGLVATIVMTAFSFNGIGIAAATTGLVHPVFAMVLSVSVVLANSFAGQLLSGEGVNADFSVEGGATAAATDVNSADLAETS